jgi:multicomponent Na+:H+ antiporter subunit G
MALSVLGWSPLEVVSAVLLLLGATVVAVAAVGLQRFDSVFARIHPATKAMTLGVVLIALGAAPRMQERGDVAKLLLAAALQLLTAPIASHMVARAAYRAGTELSPHTAVDELAGVDLDRHPDDDRPR